jgi:glycosyltransferase involved in cell wall biosynthesis
MDISVVIPLFNESESILELVDGIDKVMRNSSYTYEIVMIDDGSDDGSWELIEDRAKKNPSVRGIKFRRNYGKAAALHCGFKAAEGDVVITMDADLQDNPEEIPDLYKMIREDDYDLVSGWKKKRFDPFSKKLPSKFFNWTARKVTGIKLHDFNCGLKAYKRNVVKSIEVYGEMHRYIPVIVKKAGFSRIGEKVVQHRKRKYGATKYGVERYMHGFLALITLSFISRFGKKPMHLFGTLGTLMFLIGFIIAIYLGADKLTSVYKHIKAPLVTSSPYFYIALAAMIIGTQLFLAGFLGELVSRTSADRNAYQIEQKI